MKSIEEAANDYAMCYLNCKTECDTFETCDEKQACCNRLERNAHIAGVKFAESWIPVDEELPEESEEDLIIKIEDEGDTFHVIAIYWMGQFTDLENIYHPTHWRPISRK